MIKTSEAQSQTEQPKHTPPSKKSSKKTILALSIFALGLNAAAAAYTLSATDFALPDFSGMVAELFPHAGSSAPIPNAVDVALNDIQSAQQQNTALLQLDAMKLDTLRSSLTEERTDVKLISAQLSTLIAKVDSLQNAMAPEITSSIPKGRARNRISGVAHKRIARQAKTVGPFSVGGTPLDFPATKPAPQG